VLAQERLGDGRPGDDDLMVADVLDQGADLAINVLVIGVGVERGDDRRRLAVGRSNCADEGGKGHHVAAQPGRRFRRRGYGRHDGPDCQALVLAADQRGGRETEDVGSGNAGDGLDAAGEIADQGKGSRVVDALRVGRIDDADEDHLTRPKQAGRLGVVEDDGVVRRDQRPPARLHTQPG
jgi:hypothetical protein